MRRRTFFSALGLGIVSPKLVAAAPEAAPPKRAPATNWAYRYVMDPDAPRLKQATHVLDILEQRFGHPHPEFYDAKKDVMIGTGDMNQAWHMFQSAAYALERDWGDDVVTAALLHDLGKAVSYEKHTYFSALMIKPYVSKRIVWLTRVHFDIGYVMYPNDQQVEGRFLFADNKIDRIGLDLERMKKNPWYRDGTRVRLCDDGGRVRLQDARSYLPEIKKVLAKTFKHPKAGLGYDNSEADELWKLVIEPAWLS